MAKIKREVFKDLELMRREATPLLDLIRKRIGNDNFKIMFDQSIKIKRAVQDFGVDDCLGPMTKTPAIEGIIHQYSTPQERIREWVEMYAQAFHKIRAKIKAEVEFNSLKKIGSVCASAAEREYSSFASSSSWRSDTIDFYNNPKDPPGHHEQADGKHRFNISATYQRMAKKIGKVVVDANLIVDIRNVFMDEDVMCARVKTLTQKRREGRGYALKVNDMFFAYHKEMKVAALSDKSFAQAVRTCRSRVVKAIDEKITGGSK